MSTPDLDPEAERAFDHRLYWHSRRGMTELELKLIPFFDQVGRNLSLTEKQTLARLLAEEDWQIFDWLQGREQPEDPQLASLVGLIRAHGEVPRT